MFNGLKKNRTHMFFLSKRFNITIILSFKDHIAEMTKCETLKPEPEKNTPPKKKTVLLCIDMGNTSVSSLSRVLEATVPRYLFWTIPSWFHGNFLYSLAHTCISNATCKIRENLKTGSSCAFWCLFWFYFPQTSFHLKFEEPTCCHAMSCR